MAYQKNFLEFDDNAVGRNLKFVNNDLENNLNQYFGGINSDEVPVPPRDFKIVKPRPGFCVKTYKVNADEKYFINICQTDEIPAPEDLTEEELIAILESDAPSSYRIPMSISEPRVTQDKSNNPAEVCDIAVNPRFFAKCEKSLIFKNFFLTLIAEAINEKYNIQIKIDKAIILNHRKFIGTLVSHRVRNNDVKTVLSSYKQLSESDKARLGEIDKSSGRKVAEVIDAKELSLLKQKAQENKLAKSQKLLQEIPQTGSIEPEFKLRAKVRDDKVEELQAEFHLPKCVTAQEINLDIGEDRILVESVKYGYLFDKFVNYQLNQERASAIFDKTNKMLQIRIPVFPVM